MDEEVLTARTALDALGSGALDVDKVAHILNMCWHCLSGSADHKTDTSKLHRIEQPVWQPPILTFKLERHGRTVNGSSRADLHHWEVDFEKCSATISRVTHRQIYPMSERFRAAPVAKVLADAIIEDKEHEHLIRKRGGVVRLNMGEIVPSSFRQTTTERRNRLRSELEKLIKPHGWEVAGRDAYIKK